MRKERLYLRGSLDEYLKELSLRSATPGGGSAAALAAALGACLNLMVINYSFKKGGTTASSRGLVAARARQRKSLNKLSSLIDKDCKEFRLLTEALVSGKGAQKKYKAAAMVPMGVCRECHASMGITNRLSKSGNRNLVSDVGSAAEMLKAAFSSARLNVEINLKQIKDRTFVNSTKKKLSAMSADINRQCRGINGRVREIMRRRKKK